MRILGAVLAGGRSSRFGSDKAMATWRDTALI
ncbi:MAG: NTP transferase domain-containing protein, partial [Pseudomonadota bacterium]|nr:NTP transferase domain-containing protein [Pseudomonadota bacterium]